MTYRATNTHLADSFMNTRKYNIQIDFLKRGNSIILELILPIYYCNNKIVAIDGMSVVYRFTKM